MNTMMIRHLFSVTTGSTPSSGDESYWDGAIHWATPEDLGTLDQPYLHQTRRTLTVDGYTASGAAVVPRGSLVLTKRAPIGRVAILAIEACANQGCLLLSPKHGIDGRFYYYWLCSQSRQLNSLGRGSTFMELSTDDLKSLRAPCPSPETQRAIADFLDAETARIDALITAKENLLAILAEKRRALITQAVTRGLDQNVPMRDSGIPWLGEIPAHWDTERARWLFRERDVRSTTGNEELLTVSHLTGVTPRSEKDVNMFEAESTVGYKTCHESDLVINTMWAWMGAMGVPTCSGIVSPAYNVYWVGPRLLPAYVDVLVRMDVFAQEVTRYSKGVWSSRLRLYPEGFFEVVFPVPPLHEQANVVEAIRREVDHIDTLSSAVRRSLSLARERREAVIAAAVTGQLDVEVA